MTSPLSLPVVNQHERCCQPGECAYSPSRVRAIIHLIRNAPRYGDDPGEAAASYFGGKAEGRSPGASAGSDATRYATLVADVQQAIAAIGGRPSAEAISDKLCPYGADEQKG